MIRRLANGPQSFPCGERTGWSVIVLGLLTWASMAMTAEGDPVNAGASSRLPQTNLMLFRDAQGQVQPVKDLADWQQRRQSILAGMQAVMGPWPGPEKRCALDPRVESETDCGAYVRRFMTYASEPGSRVPAYLLVPKDVLAGEKKAPAVLCLHQTHALGHKVVVGLGNSPDDEYAVELVQRGYVCLAPAYPLLADYQPDLKALGYRSGTLKAIWDNRRGLDLLESLAYVSPGAFGAIGHSLGGHNAVFTAVCDERIKVVVSSCGLDSFLDYMNGDITGWTSDRYMPRLRDYPLRQIPFDFPELIGALAPRACFLSAPIGDTNFRWRSVASIGQAARPVYELHRVPRLLRVEHPDCSHRFPPDMRRRAYDFLDQVLKGESGPK